MAWSKYQNNIFEFVASGIGNATVKAVAGSGKSTTCVEAIKHIPAGKTYIMLAFNKTIAEELKNRGVNAKTFHSLCYSPVLRSRKTNNVETNKLRMLCRENMNSNDNFVYSTFCIKLVGLARNAGIGVLVPDTEDAWFNLVEHQDLELENERGNTLQAVRHARELLQWSNESNFVDFDDMLYFAVKDGITLTKYDYVFVDEAQDTNPIQRAIVRKICNENSRVIFVGDPAQAIYGFRGADSESIATLHKEFNCVDLPLTITYRCGTDIVKFAHKYVQHIEAADNAPTGEVRHIPGKLDAVIAATVSPEDNPNSLPTFEASDLVVCRTTKPLVELAFKMLRNRVPCKIMGRDIGNGLKALIGKMRATNLEELTVNLETWARREIDKAIAKQLESKVDQIQDKLDALLCLIDGLAEGHRTIEALLAGIDMLFNNNEQCLTLSTIHKAKGTEADRVWWLNSSKCPAPWAKQDWQREQERNLCYVAITRAKTSLFLVEDGSTR